jgi:hypothetical protein
MICLIKYSICRRSVQFRHLDQLCSSHIEDDVLFSERLTHLAIFTRQISTWLSTKMVDTILLNQTLLKLGPHQMHRLYVIFFSDLCLTEQHTDIRKDQHYPLSVRQTPKDFT